MIYIETAAKHEITINKREVLRYLGYSKNPPDGAADRLIDECIEEISKSISPKACYTKFPISVSDNTLDLSFLKVTSKGLSKNLSGCTEIILFSATIGIETDRIIQKYSRIAPSKSVVMQAIGAAAIEEWCDILSDRFKKYEAENNSFLRPRFSPGYGDFPLEHQRHIMDALDCSRKIGVTLTDGFLMIPSKSVSAIIGVSPVDTSCINSGCEMCKKHDCEYRRS